MSAPFGIIIVMGNWVGNGFPRPSLEVMFYSSVRIRNTGLNFRQCLSTELWPAEYLSRNTNLPFGTYRR